MSSNLLKFLAVVLLFALWAALVFVGKTDPAPLVAAIGAVIAGLGVHGATAKSGAETASAPLVSGSASWTPASVAVPLAATQPPSTPPQ